MIPLSLYDAINDPLIQGVPLDIFVRCFIWLEPNRYRPLPAHIPARAVRVEPKTAMRSLKLLVEHGYLERGPNAEHGVPTYRLLVTRFVRAS